MPKAQPAPARKTRIQNRNEELILDAALEVFSSFGYRGTTVDQIAAKSGLSKPNLLYYFRRKEDIYRAVLERTLEAWLAPLSALDPAADPLTELARYISAKLDMTFDRPEASRLFANEILHGAPNIGKFLRGPLKALVDSKVGVIRRWMAEGRIAAVEPVHLIYSIWAVTQHYADFGVQIEAVSGKPDREATRKAVLHILLDGLRPVK